MKRIFSPINFPWPAFRGAWALLVLLAFGLISAASAFGAPTKLSLEEAVSLALSRNEEVKVAAAEIERADAQIKEAWASALPDISGVATTTRHLDTPVMQFDTGNGIQQIPMMRDWQHQFGVQLVQPLYGFGRLGSGLRMTRLLKELREHNLAAARREMRFAVTSSYYGVQAAKEVVGASQESLANAQRNLKALERRFQGGRVPRFDNIKMASDIANRKPMLSDAQKQLELAYLQLNLLTGLPSNARPELITPLASKVAQLPAADLLDHALKRNETVQAAEAGVFAAEQRLKLAKAEHLPSLSAFGNFDYQGTGNDFFIRGENMNTSLAVGITLRVPIFQGGAVSARARQATVDREQAELALIKRQRETKSQLDSAVEQFKAGQEKKKSAEEALKLAGEAYELTRSRFGTGGATQRELNDSDLLLTNARIQLIDAKFNIHSARADIDRLAAEAAEQ